MLRTRVKTALVLLPVTLAVVFLAPPTVFKLVIGLLMVLGSREYARISSLPTNAAYLLIGLQAIVIVMVLLNWNAAAAIANGLLAAGCVLWLALFFRLTLYEEGATPDRTFRALGFVTSLIALTFCFFALSWLQEQANGPFVVALLMLLIAAADTGAYFSGKQFGRHRLSPLISPNKTWEGVYGGAALALLAGWLWATLTPLQLELPALLVISVITTLVSIGGDLYISMHKRTVKLDDSGSLFPGHGGVLDRYDSLLAGAPFFALAYGLLVT